MFERVAAVLLCTSLTLSVSTVVSAADGELFAPMTTDQVRSKSLDWAAGLDLKDRALIDAIGKLWTISEVQQRPEELHRLTVRTFEIANPDVAALVQQCEFGIGVVPRSALLEDDGLAPWFSNNLRAFVGLFLAQNEFYDEALTLLDKVQPQELVDPPSYFFDRAVCEHRLLKAKEGLATLKLLLENTSDVPVRYSTVAALMKSDLEKLEEKSLNEVARMMSDVERRLKLGRSGARVQKTEEEIVATLDELIK
ncbi:MAG: hypothetical protein O3B13_17450, partial [Planctomycetota bacterium]|nr:hypothetical protein [Planctomycetota bacterium]